MLVVDLSCPHGHRFEGWFGSADDLASQQARGLVSCPVCGDLRVQRLPSAPHLNVSHLAERVPSSSAGHAALADASGSRMAGDMAELARVAQGRQGPPGAQPAHGHPGAPTEGVQTGAAAAQGQEAQALQALYWSAVRHVLAHTEDVGERFASDARAMHHGELPARPIRGQLDAQEREALQDEGIEVVTLVVPKGLDGPVQ
jgi:hypothetical protein